MPHTSSSNYPYDIQGRFLRIPYDWRLPNWARIRRRFYLPGGPLLSPKVFGWGWGINLAHPGSRLLLAAMALFVVTMIYIGG